MKGYMKMANLCVEVFGMELKTFLPPLPHQDYEFCSQGIVKYIYNDSTPMHICVGTGSEMGQSVFATLKPSNALQKCSYTTQSFTFSPLWICIPTR